VAWTSCLESGPHVETIEVDSSHYSMPYQPRVWSIILERLKRKPVTVLPHAIAARSHARRSA